MSAGRGGPLGDALRVIQQLEPADAATRVRLTELMLGVAPVAKPTPAPERPPRPVQPEVKPPPARQRRPIRDLGRSALVYLRRIPWRQALGIVGAGLATLSGLGALAVQTNAVWLVATLAAIVGSVVAFIGSRRSLRALQASAVLRLPVVSRLISLDGSSDLATDEPASEDKLDPAGLPVDLPVDALLLPRWTPGILATTLAFETADGPLDVDRIVDDMARLKVPTDLPRRHRRSLDRGATILVDVSEGMVPLTADVDDLLAKVRRIVGPAVKVRRFDAHPLAGADRDAAADPSELQTRRVVLALTHLGHLGPPGGESASELEPEWLELGARLKHARCPLVVLAPLEPRRLPRSLRREIPVLEWDRSTTIATAARAVRR